MSTEHEALLAAREALEEISVQKLFAEMDEGTYPDLHEGYEGCVECARAALAKINAALEGADHD